MKCKIDSNVSLEKVKICQLFVYCKVEALLSEWTHGQASRWQHLLRFYKSSPGGRSVYGQKPPAAIHLKNQLGRRNLSDTQFKLMVGKEYELQKRISRGGGDRRSEEANQRSQSDTIDRRSERTRDRIANEHGISPQTVARSASLHNSIKAIQEVAPKIAKKLESEEIKASQKDIRILGKVLKQGTIEQKEQIASEIKDNFAKAVDMAKEIISRSKPENFSPGPEEPLDDRAGDVIANPEVSPDRSNSDIKDF